MTKKRTDTMNNNKISQFDRRKRQEGRVQETREQDQVGELENKGTFTHEVLTFFEACILNFNKDFS